MLSTCYPRPFGWSRSRPVAGAGVPLGSMFTRGTPRKYGDTRRGHVPHLSDHESGIWTPCDGQRRWGPRERGSTVGCGGYTGGQTDGRSVKRDHGASWVVRATRAHWAAPHPLPLPPAPPPPPSPTASPIDREHQVGPPGPAIVRPPGGNQTGGAGDGNDLPI